MLCYVCMYIYLICIYIYTYRYIFIIYIYIVPPQRSTILTYLFNILWFGMVYIYEICT
jgi:hypothetical protein